MCSNVKELLRQCTPWCLPRLWGQPGRQPLGAGSLRRGRAGRAGQGAAIGGRPPGTARQGPAAQAGLSSVGPASRGCAGASRVTLLPHHTSGLRSAPKCCCISYVALRPALHARNHKFEFSLVVLLFGDINGLLDQHSSMAGLPCACTSVPSGRLHA